MERLKLRWAPLALAVLILVGVGATTPQEGGGVGMVNLMVIMPQTPGYQEALTVFESEFQPEQEDLEILAGQVDSLISEYDRTQATLSATVRQEKSDEIRRLQTLGQQRTQELDARRTERERELVTPLEQRVQTVIDGIRAERNLSVVFDMAALPGAIVAMDPIADLTALVVERLQGQ